MKNIILAIDRVEPGLVSAAKRIEKELGHKLKGIRLVGESYKKMQGGTYAPDESNFFKEILVDYNDSTQLQEIFKKYGDDILAVNCRDESSIGSFRRVIPFIPDVPAPTETSLVWATEKVQMRKMLSAYDKSLTPKFIKIRENKINDARKLLEDFTFPVIIKPSGLHTSMLVKQCKTMDEIESSLEAAYDVIHEIYWNKSGNGEPVMMIEEFMVGDMYSVDVYIEPDGKSLHFAPPVRVVTSHDVGLNGFYGYERVVPTDLDTKDIAAANKACAKAIYALHLRSCTAHIELYKTKEGWIIVEVGPRIGGNRERLYKLSYNIDHYYNDLASRIKGMSVDIPTEPIATATCINIHPNEEGIITQIEGTEKAQALPTNIYVRQLANVGDRVVSAEHGGIYSVDAVFAGKDREQVMEDTRRGHELIKVKVQTK